MKRTILVYYTLFYFYITSFVYKKEIVKERKREVEKIS